MMTNFVPTANATPTWKFRGMFKPRDIFLHDGKSLRRYTIGAGVQKAAAFAAVVLLAWSAFASVLAVGVVAERLDGVGGPLEAAQPTQTADPRFRELFANWRRLEQVEQTVVAIPAGKPVQTANFTSGFGVRSDPFRGRAAMHGGIDLAGPVGTPIYATADGVVGRSEWNSGGYGNLVEIDHGEGIQTRYGHLSRLIARPGQRVARGDLIGLMGSTGRSTGSHLHYEVRIDGRAVNPIPFMQSSETVLAAQRRIQSAPEVALGGPTGGQR